MWWEIKPNRGYWSFRRDAGAIEKLLELQRRDRCIQHSNPGIHVYFNVMFLLLLLFILLFFFHPIYAISLYLVELCFSYLSEGLSSYQLSFLGNILHICKDIIIEPYSWLANSMINVSGLPALLNTSQADFLCDGMILCL